MAMYYKPPEPDHDNRLHDEHYGRHHGEEERPPVPDPVDVLNEIIPPDDQIGPGPPEPPVVVVQPVVQPPAIKPPPPDMMPPTIVPPEYEDPGPPGEMKGGGGVKAPPGSTIVSGALAAHVGTMMIYLGKRLLLTLGLAAAQGATNELGMLYGGLALGSKRARGVRVLTHTGNSGNQAAPGGDLPWRGIATFGYWEK